MRVAIIGGDNKFLYYLKERLASDVDGNWDILFFKDSHDFGKIDIKIFNAIIAYSKTNPMSGFELLKSIREKTDADLYLMCDTVECLSQLKSSHNFISGIVLNDVERIIDKFRYLETKYRLQNMIAAEGESINRAVVSANGYSFEINNDIAFIEIKRVLYEENKSGIINKLQDACVNKAIVSYPDRDYIEISHCSQIFEIYKSLSKNGGKMAFCNTNHNKADIFNECKMDQIIPIFENKEEAVEFLHT
ncbi:MAG: hypothetical protein DRN81_01120 [Thermoproteota archaeon]|nr:MAG: hypothetical protein DRN81_01120 [Candidatus Korarchaeota archaeon]